MGSRPTSLADRCPSQSPFPPNVSIERSAVLLGGVNLVRALGLAASRRSSPRPKRTSRHSPEVTLRGPVRPPTPVAHGCRGGCHRDDRRAPRRCSMDAASPLFYGSDDFLEAHLCPPGTPRASLRGSPQHAASRRGPPHQGRLPGLRAREWPARARPASWDGTGAASAAAFRPGRREAQQQGRMERFTAAQARVWESQGAGVSHRRARPRPIRCSPSSTTSSPASNTSRGDDSLELVVPRVRGQQGTRRFDCFTGRKIRTFPPDNGESAYIELAENEDLRVLGTRLAACIPLKGAFKMDFKQDARTRTLVPARGQRALQPLALPRRGGTARTSCALPTIFLLGATHPESARPRHNIRWLSFELDLACIPRAARRAQAWHRRMARLLLDARKVYNLFAWNDPGPWLAFWSHRLLRMASRPLDASSPTSANGSLRRPRRHPRQPRGARSGRSSGSTPSGSIACCAWATSSATTRIPTSACACCSRAMSCASRVTTTSSAPGGSASSAAPTRRCIRSSARAGPWANRNRSTCASFHRMSCWRRRSSSLMAAYATSSST